VNKIEKILIVSCAVVLLFLAGVVLAHSEAQVLRVGSTYTLSDGTVVTVTDQRFVLDRSDMDAATYALRSLPVDAATILQLQSVSDGQQRTIDSDGRWKTWIGVGAFVIGVLVDEVVRR
jgi:hypothetical protein